MIPPIVAPFMPTAPPPPPAHQGFVKRGGWWVCTVCALEESYCRCSGRPLAEGAPEEANAAASLSQRIAEVKR